MLVSFLLIPIVLLAVYITLIPKTKKVLRPIKVRSTHKEF